MPNIRDLTRTNELPTVTTFLDNQGSAPTGKTAVVTTNATDGIPTGIAVDAVEFNLVQVNDSVRRWVSQTKIGGRAWTINTTGEYAGMIANLAT